jgi:hypothetical protein
MQLPTLKVRRILRNLGLILVYKTVIEQVGQSSFGSTRIHSFMTSRKFGFLTVSTKMT